MTCSGCEQSLINILLKLGQVTDVTANYKYGTLTVYAREFISVPVIQKVLPKKYSVLEYSTGPTKKIKQLFPLIIIFGFILFSTILIHYPNFNQKAMMPDFMGMFFIVFSFFKFLDLRGFKNNFEIYDPIAAFFPLYGWFYPFIELILGICYVRDIISTSVLITTIILLATTSIGVTKTLLKKQEINCACLGSVLNIPMTEATLIENTIMVVMAVGLLV